MFTYLISPENGNQTTLLLALSIQGDTITGYVKQVSVMSQLLSQLPIIGNYFPLGTTVGHFLYCLNEYADVNNITFTKHYDPEHHKAHSNATEFHIKHYHANHKKLITYDVLEDFLSKLEQCEPIQRITTGASISNSKIIKDILQKFKLYERELQQNSDMYCKHVMTGNNPEYLALPSDKPLPTIAEHATCLELENSTGCTSTNPMSPDHLRSAAINKDPNVADDNQALIKANLISGIALSAFALSLFYRCKNLNSKQAKPTGVNLENTNIKKKRK